MREVLDWEAWDGEWNEIFVELRCFFPWPLKSYLSSLGRKLGDFISTQSIIFCHSFCNVKHGSLRWLLAFDSASTNLIIFSCFLVHVVLVYHFFLFMFFIFYLLLFTVRSFSYFASLSSSSSSSFFFGLLISLFVFFYLLFLSISSSRFIFYFFIFYYYYYFLFFLPVLDPTSAF